MKRFFLVSAFIFLTAVLSLSAGDKKKPNGFYQHPGLTADLGKVSLSIAQQKCENWAVAAGLETMLKSQGVALSQSFWVMRLNSGELCVEGMPSMEKLADTVNHEFVLDDGRHVHLELRFSAGAPVDLDSIIAGIQQQKPTLMLLRGHTYYLTGVTYDEYVGANNTRRFIIKALRLADTFGGGPGIVFTNGEDKTEDIEGVLDVSVTWLER